jgi:hypothetical protein
MYDGEPYFIFAITNHKSDGIFRMYLFPSGLTYNDAVYKGVVPRVQDFGPSQAELGPYLDKWIEEKKDTPVLRKMANSPKFNQFRPFPLGMLNWGGTAQYLERSPERRTQQGLIRTMVDSTVVSLDGKVTRNYQGSLSGPEFYDCVKGTHPSAKECLDNLPDPEFSDLTSVAFHRYFAIARGPLGLYFLSYKGDVVGLVPQSKSPEVELAKKFAYLKETVEETKQFTDIRIRN